MRNRLILLEGIPGSGKTTTSKKLFDYLINKGMDARLYNEGIEHPIDLPFHAYLTMDEYSDLLDAYPQHRDYLTENAVSGEGYMLVPYNRAHTPACEGLTNDLKSKEFCYSDTPAAPFDVFAAVFKKRFADFVGEAAAHDSVIVLESTLLQHQIHDINRNYPALPDEDIIRHLCELADILSPLNPMLFYLSQQNVADALTRTAQVRGKSRWALPETIAYYEKRKRLELAAIERFRIKSKILDNTMYRWEDMFRELCESICI